MAGAVTLLAQVALLAAAVGAKAERAELYGTGRTAGDSAMSESSLPMNTVLDGPERDPLLDDEAIAILKAVYLKQPQALAFRARGMSDAEIVNAMHDIAQAGLLKIAQKNDRASLVPAESPADLTPQQRKAKAKRRQRRRLFRR